MFQTIDADSRGLNLLGSKIPSKITSKTTLQMTSVKIICPIYNVDLSHMGVVKLSFTAITILQSSSLSSLFYQLLRLEEFSQVEHLNIEEMKSPSLRELSFEVSLCFFVSSPARWQVLGGSTLRRARSREPASLLTRLCPSSPPVFAHV